MCNCKKKFKVQYQKGSNSSHKHVLYVMAEDRRKAERAANKYLHRIEYRIVRVDEVEKD